MPLIIAFLLFSFEIAEICGDCNIIDLSHAFKADTIYWPTASNFKLTEVYKGPAGPKGEEFYYSANNYAAAEHGGTHIDAPIHFFEGRRTVDQLPLQSLMGEACVVDVSKKVNKKTSKTIQSNADYLVSVADFTDWESENGKIHECLLLVNTGWAAFWPNRTLYLGANDGTAENLRFPGIDPEAARWLVENRKVKALGLDTASLDFGRSKTFESHQILGEANIPGLENLKSLDELPARGAVVMALPMKIFSGSGAPTRVIAFKDQRTAASCLGLKNGASTSNRVCFLGVFLALILLVIS